MAAPRLFKSGIKTQRLMSDWSLTSWVNSLRQMLPDQGHDEGSPEIRTRRPVNDAPNSSLVEGHASLNGFPTIHRPKKPFAESDKAVQGNAGILWLAITLRRLDPDRCHRMAASAQPVSGREGKMKPTKSHSSAGAEQPMKSTHPDFNRRSTPESHLVSSSSSDCRQVAR